jgi:DNA-directed RNA polymerase subunit omega
MAKKKIEEVEQQIVEAEGKPPDQAWFVPSDDERSIYRFIIAAAKRARQLQGGARPLISTTSRKPTKIAMEEVRRGEIDVEIMPDPELQKAAEE